MLTNSEEGANRVAGVMVFLDWLYDHGPNPDSVKRERLFELFFEYVRDHPGVNAIDPHTYIERLNIYSRIKAERQAIRDAHAQIRKAVSGNDLLYFRKRP